MLVINERHKKKTNENKNRERNKKEYIRHVRMCKQGKMSSVDPPTYFADIQLLS